MENIERLLERLQELVGQAFQCANTAVEENADVLLIGQTHDLAHALEHVALRLRAALQTPGAQTQAATPPAAPASSE